MHDTIAAGAPPLPAAVLLEPVIIPIFGDKRIGNRAGGDPPTISVSRDDVERDSGISVTAAVTGIDLHTQVEGLSANLEFQTFTDRSTAWLEDTRGKKGLQRLRSLTGFGGVECGESPPISVGNT